MAQCFGNVPHHVRNGCSGFVSGLLDAIFFLALVVLNAKRVSLDYGKARRQLIPLCPIRKQGLSALYHRIEECRVGPQDADRTARPSAPTYTAEPSTIP
ncbi:hypothetical protein RR48_09690 [Papilio machaon]|uniref:Uncharacterized protein n=1 Tax=Papilio machaon TaxID=76193 RepID=A0A194RDT5_PAPMA|nr:hypothetical protein RR48_09690 [Papilio machaon]